MLELHTSDVPSEYRSLLPFLLTPAVWLQKGSVPGLVKLLKAFVARDATQMAAQGQLPSVLAVIQQRLIPSKANDMWGFELLYSIVRYTPMWVLQLSSFIQLADRARLAKTLNSISNPWS